MGRLNPPATVWGLALFRVLLLLARALVVLNPRFLVPSMAADWDLALAVLEEHAAAGEVVEVKGLLP